MSSLDFVLLGALAVIVGALIPVQAATNAAMSRVIGSVAITSLALFAIGFGVVAAWAIVLRVPLPSLERLRHVPAYGWFGGVIVASYVISITFIAPRLGVGNAIRLVVTGQIVVAVLIDHVGAFGAVVQRLTMGRAMGAVLMIIGVNPVLARTEFLRSTAGVWTVALTARMLTASLTANAPASGTWPSYFPRMSILP